MLSVQTINSYGLVGESWLEEINGLLKQSELLTVKSKAISQMAMDCSEELQILLKQSQLLLEKQQLVIFRIPFSS